MLSLQEVLLLLWNVLRGLARYMQLENGNCSISVEDFSEKN